MKAFLLRRSLSYFALLACVLSLAAGSPFARGKRIDLTHDFSTNTLYWPTAQKFASEVEFHAHTDKGYFYAANRYGASEHGGTHIDAPIHFAERGKTLDQLAVEQLTGPAVVVDVSAKANKDADYQVTVADLKAWEARHGRIPNASILLINTGYARHWPDAKNILARTNVERMPWRNCTSRPASGRRALARRRTHY